MKNHRCAGSLVIVGIVQTQPDVEMCDYIAGSVFHIKRQPFQPIVVCLKGLIETDRVAVDLQVGDFQRRWFDWNYKRFFQKSIFSLLRCGNQRAEQAGCRDAGDSKW